jgi:chitosanase
MEAADDVGLETALARAQLYDTAVQHGAGDDPDGLYAIIDRTVEAVGTPEESGERVWLDAFFDERIATLNDPANAETAEAWRESVSRVECMQGIADAGNDDLDGPIRCTVYGDEFTID